MYDPMKSVPIDASEQYVVSGNDLIEMNSRIEKIHADLKWMRARLAENLSSLANGGADGFVRFVAGTGLILQTLNETIGKWNSYGLSNAPQHLGLDKVAESFVADAAPEEVG